MEDLERDRPVVARSGRGRPWPCRRGRARARRVLLAPAPVAQCRPRELSARHGRRPPPASWNRGCFRRGSKVGIHPQPPRREVVRDPEQRLELVQRLLRLASHDVDPDAAGARMVGAVSARPTMIGRKGDAPLALPDRVGLAAEIGQRGTRGARGAERPQARRVTAPPRPSEPSRRRRGPAWTITPERRSPGRVHSPQEARSSSNCARRQAEQELLLLLGRGPRRARSRSPKYATSACQGDLRWAASRRSLERRRDLPGRAGSSP